MLKWAAYRFLNRHVLPRWGFVLRKSGADGDNFAVSEAQRLALVRALAAALEPFLAGPAAKLLAPGDGPRLERLIAEFIALFAGRPVRDNAGGAGFNSSLCLFLTARLLQPQAIVDSGTFQGHSAWLFRRACPGAVIHSFDIEHDNLIRREADIRYHLGDWSTVALPDVQPARALACFDDHVSHARRLREAQARGFRLLILDDNLPAHALHATGDPPAPTLAMLFDERLQAGDEIAWVRRGRAHRLRLAAEDLAARDLVERWAPFPDLGPVSRYSPNAGLALVRLKA